MSLSFKDECVGVIGECVCSRILDEHPAACGIQGFGYGQKNHINSPCAEAIAG